MGLIERSEAVNRLASYFREDCGENDDTARVFAETILGRVPDADSSTTPGAVATVEAALANVRAARDPSIEGHVGLLRDAESMLVDALTAIGGGSA